MRRITSLFLLVSFILSNTSVKAADSAANEPVKNAEVVVATFDDDGKLVPVGEPIPVDSQGHFDYTVPASIPEHKPLFVIAQPEGDATGVQQIAPITGDGEVEVDPEHAAIANTLMSFANETGAFDPKDMDINQIKEFVHDMEATLADIPPAANAADTIERMAQAMSFKPEEIAEKMAKHFKGVPPEDIFHVVSMIDQAAAPTGFNPFEGIPDMPDKPPPGSHIAGLFHGDGEKGSFMDKFMPPHFDPLAFCEHCPPPGGFEYIGEDGKPAPIPEGTFMMPPGLRADTHAEFPDEAVFPQGVELPEGFHMPPNAVVPPGVILGEGFEPPHGFELPPGLIMPEGFDPVAFGAKFAENFEPPVGFEPPPGFAVTGKHGEFMMPPGFHMPPGVEIPENALAFPAPEGFEPPPLPEGFEDFAGHGIHPPPLGHSFGPDFHPPRGWDPADAGFVPPPGFIAHEFGEGIHHDFDQFKGDDFHGFDPFGGKFEVPDHHGEDGEFVPFIPPDVRDHLGDNFDPNNFNPEDFFGAPPPGHKPGEGPDGTFDPNQPHPDGTFDPNQPHPDGTFDPNQPHHGDNFDPNQPHDGTTGDPNAGHDPNQPAAAGHDPHQPAPTDGHHGDAPPPAGDTGAPPPPPATGDAPPPARIKLSKYAVSANAGENSDKFVGVHAAGKTTVKAGVKLALTIDTNSKGKKATGTEGVYQVGKAKAGKTSTTIPVIVDPSITGDTAKVNVAEKDNSVDTASLEVDKTNTTQLITQLSDNKKEIEMSTANSGAGNLELSRVKGYLLPPGTSTAKMLKAIPVKGKVLEGASGQVVSFKVPKKKLAAGVYTVEFANGDDVYYGKVTIGTLEARTVSGTVSAPGGSL